MSNLLSKISVATVYGRIKTAIKDVDGEQKKYLPAPVALMRVIGQCTGFEVKTSQYGDSLKFSGSFKAINLETGEVYHSGACFLPTVLESQLGGVLDSVDSGVEFAVDIAAVPAENSFGYEYRVKTLLEVQEAPVLAAIEQKIAHLALPGPGQLEGDGEGKGKADNKKRK